MTLIKLTQSPVIDYAGIKGISELVDKRMKALNIDSQVATTDTVKSLKAMRATLNKEYKEYEEQRKTIKNLIAKPYQAFESEYKNLIATKFIAADSTLKSKIMSVDNEVKEQKEEKVKAYFEELTESKGIDFINFSQVGLNITLTVSEKKLKEEVTVFVEKIADDLQTIEVLPEDAEFKTEVLVEYRNTLDRNHSIKVIQDRRAELKRIEEAKQAEQQRKEAEDNRPAPTQEQPKAEPLQAPTVEAEKPKEYEATFTVKGTMEQLKTLKAYMIDNGIQIIK